jgi:hypothetical protein
MSNSVEIPLVTSAALLLTCAWLAGCAADDGGSGDGGAADTDADTDSDTDADTDADTGEDTGTEFEECSEVSESAQNALSPVDIVIAVDNSGSMTAEAGYVQENMNGFSQQIVESGIDVHIVLLTASSTMSNGICVDAPLGSGTCPDDTNLPVYLHHVVQVESTDALYKIWYTYPYWSDMLREGSIRHFVVVSDDNSADTPEWFLESVADLVPPVDELTFHAIASYIDPWPACAADPPHPCCEFSAHAGTVYQELALATGGIFADLCVQDFQPVFDELAEVVADVPIACAWDIPDPPDDEVFDKDKVNVDYIDGDDQVHPIGHVDLVAQCEDVSHAWYYDDNEEPTTVRVCPQTCAWIQADPQATIVIKFGCETEDALE